MTLTPHRCPVCDGRGTVPFNFYSGSTLASNTSPVECRSCAGKGYLVLSDDNEPVKADERHVITIRPPDLPPDFGRSPFWYDESPYGGPRITSGGIYSAPKYRTAGWN